MADSRYPREVFGLVRQKTFSIEAAFSKAKDDIFLKVFDGHFSRFIFAVVAEGKGATGNFPVSEFSGLKRRSEYAYKKQLSLMNDGEKGKKEHNSAAYTVRFRAGKLKGKTPVDVILENGKEAKEILNEQYKFLKQNVKKYPANQEIMDAISEAAKIPKEDLENAESTQIEPFTLFKMPIRPLQRRKRPDGLAFVYEYSVEWDFNMPETPVHVHMRNFYAPVVKTEKGLLNVQAKKMDKSSEVNNTFDITADEWMEAIDSMEMAITSFHQMNFPEMFKKAEDASRNVRASVSQKERTEERSESREVQRTAKESTENKTAPKATANPSVNKTVQSDKAEPARANQAKKTSEQTGEKEPKAQENVQKVKVICESFRASSYKEDKNCLIVTAFTEDNREVKVRFGQNYYNNLDPITQTSIRNAVMNGKKFTIRGAYAKNNTMFCFGGVA